MTIVHIALMMLIIMGLLGTFLVCLRMLRLYNDGLVPYKDAAYIGWIAFGLHTIMWLVLNLR